MRKANLMTSVFGAALVAGLVMGSAQAQTVCESTEFTAKPGEKYLKAETELYANENPSGALKLANEMKAMELNCYERGVVLRLSAQAKLKMNDTNGAVQDMEEAIRIGAIAEKDLATTYLNIAQIYLSAQNVEKAKTYMEKWLAKGGKPNRDQNNQLAIIYTKLDDFNKALPYAERVFRADGANVSNQTIDFLIFLYDRTGNRAKKAEMLELKLTKNPTDLNTWRAIAGEYFQAGDERKAFEVYKAMYLGGLLNQEDDLMRIVNFYNRFNAPFESAKVLEKEINKGTIKASLERLDQLANLYQVSREYDRAIPVIQRAADMSSNGETYHRLGRSYFELKNHEKAIDAFQKALNKGGLKRDKIDQAYMLIGQSNYELNNREAAREAFAKGGPAGRQWIAFMNAEVETQKQLAIHQAGTKLEGIRNEKKGCEKLKVLGQDQSASCADVDARLKEAEAKFIEVGGKI